MKSANWIRAAAVTALMASACGGSTPTAGISPSPSAAASPSASPTAAKQCTSPSNRCLALVTLRGSNSYVVRDISDISHPKTVSNLGAITAPVFVSAGLRFALWGILEANTALTSDPVFAGLAGVLPAKYIVETVRAMAEVQDKALRGTGTKAPN